MCVEHAQYCSVGKLTKRSANDWHWVDDSEERSMDLQKRVQELVEIANAYYLEGKTQSQIARERGGRHASQISRDLKEARGSGIVEIRINDRAGAAPVERVTNLESALLNNFSLRIAVVVDASRDLESIKQSMDADQDKPEEEERKHRLDDELHKYLGRAMADLLRTSLRSGDHIGVGGGRATFFTADALFKQTWYPNAPLSQRDVRIMSLNGNSDMTMLSASLEGPEANYPLDSDAVGLCLCRAFSHASLCRVSQPLINDQRMTQSLLKNGAYFLSKSHWAAKPAGAPNFLIAGIGAYTVPHRLQQAKGAVFRKVKRHVEDLNTWTEQIRKKLDYEPVGDVLNRLFLIPPPPDRKPLMLDRDENILKKIDSKIREINNQMLTIEFDQLEMVNTVAVVAGGRRKFDAIYHVLTDFCTPECVDILVTDRETAQALVKRRSIGNSFRAH